MRIFISYSTPDIQTVIQLANELKQFGEVSYWNENKVLGAETWDTICNWIDSSDLVIVLITGNTVHRAMSVGQEVGQAKAKHITIFPLVTEEVPQSELGFLAGITYQQIDIKNPLPAIQRVVQNVHSRKLEKENTQKTFVFLAAVGFILFLLTRE